MHRLCYGQARIVDFHCSSFFFLLPSLAATTCPSFTSASSSSWRDKTWPAHTLAHHEPESITVTIINTTSSLFILLIFTYYLLLFTFISVQVTIELSDLAGEQLLAEEQAAQVRADAKKAKKLRKKQKRKQAQQLTQHDEVRRIALLHALQHKCLSVWPCLCFV